MHHAYSRSPNNDKPMHSTVVCFVPRDVNFFLNHSLHALCILLVNRIQVVLHCKHEVSNLHLLLFTLDRGFVLVVLTVIAVLSFGYHGYASKLVMLS